MYHCVTGQKKKRQDTELVELPFPHAYNFMYTINFYLSVTEIKLDSKLELVPLFIT